jgi:hypothetical protein
MVALRDQLTYKKLRLSARYPNIKFTGEDALEADAVWVVLNFMDGDNGHLKATVSKGVKVRLYDADYLTCVCLHGTGRDALEHVEVAWMTYVDSNNTTAFLHLDVLGSRNCFAEQ